MNHFPVLHCLHGFFGHPTDWAPVFPPDVFKIIGHDLLRMEMDLDLRSMGREINRAAMARSKKRVLIGYSLGGRIALHALLESPEAWDAAVIISANPGLATVQERAQQREQDEKWALRIESENWDSLMRDWNSRPVFEGSQPITSLSETPSDRKLLSNALRRWSLGTQEDLTPALSDLTIPILFIAGEADGKYTALLKNCARQNPRFQIDVIAGAGHRVPWDAPATLRRKVTEFLNNNGAMAHLNGENTHEHSRVDQSRRRGPEALHRY